MIRRPEALQPLFVPNDLLHRDAELTALTSALQPVLRGDGGSPTLITGPSGAGKTCSCRHVVEQLEDESGEVRTAYVNCWTTYQSFGVVCAVLDELGMATDVHRQATSPDVAIDRLRDGDSRVVVIMDEADQLADPALLYRFYEIPSVTQVLIAQREEALFGSVDNRLRSRLQGCERIHFDSYRTAELTDILRSRASVALVPESVGRSQVESIADRAAGDARLAIAALRAVANAAEADGATRVTDEHVESAVPTARERLRKRDLSSLRPIQQTLYAVVYETAVAESRGAGVEPGAIYRNYRSRVEEPKTDRTVRRHLNKLEQYNLITVTGTSKDRRYGLPTDAPSPSNFAGRQGRTGR